MKFPMNVILLLSLAAAGSALGVAAVDNPQPVQPDVQATELSISIREGTPEEGSGSATFDVTILNTGDECAILNLGWMIANGKGLLPNAIQLVLNGPDGQSKELQYSDRKYAAIAGRVDDYVVPLRAGSAYTLTLSLADYWIVESLEKASKLEAGEYSVRAEFTGRGAHHINRDMDGMRTMRFWTGKIKSDPSAFRVGTSD